MGGGGGGKEFPYLRYCKALKFFYQQQFIHTLLVGIRKHTMPRVASCVRIRSFADIITPCCMACGPRMHTGCTLRPTDAYGVLTGPPECTRGNYFRE